MGPPPLRGANIGCADVPTASAQGRGVGRSISPSPTHGDVGAADVGAAQRRGRGLGAPSLHGPARYPSTWWQNGWLEAQCNVTIFDKIVCEGEPVNPRIREAYLDNLLAQGEAGIFDDSITEGAGGSRSYEERIVDILRKAGRLPEGWDEHPQ